MAESIMIMARNEFDVSSAQVLALLAKSNCSSYDCEFIALAQYLNFPLVTQDKKILREFSPITISIADFIENLRPSADTNQSKRNHGLTKGSSIAFFLK
jgi:hypothetical protein